MAGDDGKKKGSGQSPEDDLAKLRSAADDPDVRAAAARAEARGVQAATVRSTAMTGADALEAALEHFEVLRSALAKGIPDAAALAAAAAAADAMKSAALEAARRAGAAHATAVQKVQGQGKPGQAELGKDLAPDPRLTFEEAGAGIADIDLVELITSLAENGWWRPEARRHDPPPQQAKGDAGNDGK